MANSPEPAQSSGFASTLYSTLQTANSFQEMYEKIAGLSTSVDVLIRQNKSFVNMTTMTTMLEQVKDEAKDENKLEMFKFKKELTNQFETMVDEMTKKNEEANKQLRLKMENQLAEAKAELQETFTTAIQKVKAECISLDVVTNDTVMNEVHELCEKNYQSVTKAQTLATAKCVADAEEHTSVQVCVLNTTHTAFVESTNTKIEVMNKRFRDLFEEVTDKFVSFTQEHVIKAQQHKIQIAGSMQVCESRPSSRGDDRHKDQAHAIELTNRHNWTALRRQDTGGEEARVEADLVIRDDADFVRWKEYEQLQAHQLQMLQEYERSGDNSASRRSFQASDLQRQSGRAPMLTHQAVEQLSSQFQGVAADRAPSLRSNRGGVTNEY